MSNKISVITVVYNDVAHIRETMESFFSQTWEDKEYIVVDGGSTDGTVDIIRGYADRLAWWCSEPDDGIYDAMNKGISHCMGDWINVLNCGDTFASSQSLEQVITRTANIDEADIIYGDSIERCGGSDIYRYASEDVNGLSQSPIYRHGSSLVRSNIQKSHLYDTEQKNKYGFALDWLLIHSLFKEGYRFRKVNAIIELFLTEGVSNQPRQGMIYNRLVTNGGNPLTAADWFSISKGMVILWLKGTSFYKWLIAFLTVYLLNNAIPCIPFWSWRRAYMRRLKMHIGAGTFIMKHNYIITPQQLSIGDHSHINRGCLIDARGRIEIGSNVSISHNVNLVTGSHDLNAPNFQAKFLPIRIEDYAWIGINATILQNTTIGRGAVVCAGAVVTKDVQPYDVVAGIPAHKIGTRTKELKYQCNGQEPFT